MSAARRDFLVEIGTEELPPKSLLALADAFAAGIGKGLDEAGLLHGAVERFATPRRLAVRVRRLAERQPDRAIERRGPPLKAAFDAQGAPTQAALAFAKSCGVEVSALERIETPEYPDRMPWLHSLAYAQWLLSDLPKLDLEEYDYTCAS